MKALNEQISKEYNLSRKLRESAWEQDSFEKCVEMRKKQEKHWKKYNFLKNLSEALNKEKGGNKDGKADNLE